MLDIFSLPDSKYKLKQRSVSINKNETRMHTYPSVTICHAFKDNKDVVMDILNERNETNIPQKSERVYQVFFIIFRNHGRVRGAGEQCQRPVQGV